MALSSAVKAELETELDALKLKKRLMTEEIDRRIGLIEDFLRDDFFQPTLPMAEQQAKPQNGNGSRAGMRKVLIDILGSNPAGIRTSTIVSLVESSGFKPSGKTSLKRLTWGELWRLRDSNLVVRVGQGKKAKYRLRGEEQRESLV
jgi:hypothetical protein